MTIKIVVTRLDRAREAETRRLNLSQRRSDRKILSTKEPHNNKLKYFISKSRAMIFPEKLNAWMSLE